MRSLPVVIAALLTIAAAPQPEPERDPPSADAGGPVTPADIMTLQDMREVEMAPNGRSILFTVQPQISTFSPEHPTIWRVPTDGSAPARRFIISAGADDHPRWSPDGNWIAFLSDREHPLSDTHRDLELKGDSAAQPGKPAAATPLTAAAAPDAAARQVWLMPASGGEALPLTALPGEVGDFAWSPDGKRIALLSADPPSRREMADKAARHDWVEIDKPVHFTRLWIVDLASHTARCVSPDGVNISTMDWSPDGKRLALTITAAPGSNDFFYHARLYLLDATTGILGQPFYDHVAAVPRWSPDGRSILVEEILTPGFIGTALRTIDVASGRVTKLADAYPGEFTHAEWSPDGRSIRALSFERTRSKLVRIDSRDGQVTPISAFDGEAADVSASHDSKRIAVALSSPDRPADVWVITEGKAQVVTQINPQVVDWKLGRVEQIAWKNSKDGQTIYGVLVTPPGYVPGTPTKMVVQGHGGPEWAWWSGWLGSWHEWAQMLATHGYVVFLPNPRGSDGQGTAFARAVGSDWGGMDYQDILDGVDKLVADKIADPARLGIGGWSYGGFLAARAVTHDHRFKAAVVGAGLTDMTAFSRITDTPDFPIGYFGAIDGHLPLLDRTSPVRALNAGVTTPVLVLHGEEDTRVPATLGLEFFRGLKMLGKDAEMVRYPREPHWFHEPAHQQDVQRRVLAWFDKHL